MILARLDLTVGVEVDGALRASFGRLSLLQTTSVSPRRSWPQHPNRW